MSEQTNGYDGSSNTYNHDFEEIEIPVPWGHISGKWWGPKAIQPIIALHGWQDNAGSFDTLAPILKNNNLSVLCIDLPGHGLSSHFPKGMFCYIFWDGVHILRRIIKYFNWTNVTLMGHSLGSGIEFIYSATYPDEVAKYISIDLASPSVRDINKLMSSMGKSVDKFLEYEELPPDRVPCYDYDEMIDLVADGHNGSITRESAKIMVRRGMRPAEGQPGHYVFNRDVRLKVSGLAFFTLDQTFIMASRIKCEVLNIRADPGLEFPVYDEVLDVMEKTAKKVERHVVKGTHHLHLNDPESISNIIINFVKFEC